MRFGIFCAWVSLVSKKLGKGKGGQNRVLVIYEIYEKINL